jgi:phosphoglycolate phosphatase
MYRAVLFDLDGTLLDTIDDLADSMNVVLAAMGFPPRGVAECKYFVGDGARNFALRSLPEDRRDEPTVQRCLQLYREQYARRWDVKTRPYPGIADLLDELARRGVQAAVLSNKPDDMTQLTVRRLLPRWSFAAVKGVGPDGIVKPDPTAAVAIANQLGLAPTEFLYVGDTNTDMRTAVAAGMFPVGALWGFRPAEELLASGAKALIERPGELVELI